MRYIVTLNGKQFEVDVERGKATAVYTGPAPEPAAQPAPAAPAAPAPAAPAPAASAGNEKPIQSPMPGTILEVRCVPGQAVKSGDILFILEAMKMENEICAPMDGTITAVPAAKGAVVDTGTLLATMA